NAGGFAAGVFCGCLAYRARIKRNRGAVAAILRRRKVGRSRYDKQGLGGYPQASATSALIAGQRPTTYINAKMKTTDIAQTKIESERRRYGVLKSAKGLSKGSTGTLLPSASALWNQPQPFQFIRAHTMQRTNPKPFKKMVVPAAKLLPSALTPAIIKELPTSMVA